MKGTKAVARLAAFVILLTVSLFMTGTARAAEVGPNIAVMTCKPGVAYFKLYQTNGATHCFAYTGTLPLDIDEVERFDAGNNWGTFTYLDPHDMQCKIWAFKENDSYYMPYITVLSLEIGGSN
jgi:hypothetical protein